MTHSHVVHHFFSKILLQNMFHFWSSGLTIIVFLVTGIDRGDDVPVDMLTRIYERISRQELKTGADHTTQVRKVEETMVGKLPVSS